MPKNKKKQKELTPHELLKMETAKELGLWEKISTRGWSELTAEESGRIGGIMTRKKLQKKK